MEAPFVYRANSYKKVLAFDYDFRKVEEYAKRTFEGKTMEVNELVADMLKHGQFDNPSQKKSYEKMLQDKYIRFDVGKGHGILFFFDVPTTLDEKLVYVNCIVAS